MKKTNGKRPTTKTFAATVGRALRRAGQAARKTARAHGTLAGRQSGGAETMKPSELETRCLRDFHSKDVNNRFKKLGLHQ